MSVVSKLNSLLTTRKYAVLVSYLYPRAYPFLLVIAFTFFYGTSGVGEIALLFSILSFLSVVLDWGVSQWLLMRPSVQEGQIRTAIIGRFSVAIIAIALLYLASATLLHYSRLELIAFTIGLVGCIPQLSFSLFIHGERYRTALVVGALEYVLPLVLIPFVKDPLSALTAILSLKLLVSLVTSILGVKALDRDATGPLHPRRFGTNYSLWALTSVGGGMGELYALNGASTLVSGAYRIIQTCASAGSIVGFAVQAPLLGSSGQGAITGQKKKALALASVSSAAAVVALLVLRPWRGLEGTSYQEFIIVAICFLLLNAAFSSVAVLPATSLTRIKGSRPLLYSGLFSAATYWIAVLMVTASGRILLIPVIPVLSTIVGTGINILQLRRLTRAA